MELIPSNKGKQRLVNYVGVNKFREVILVTSNPTKIYLVQIVGKHAQVYNPLSGEVTNSTTEFTCLQKWVEVILKDYQSNKVLAFTNVKAKFKLLMRVSEANPENLSAALADASEHADMYEIVEAISAQPHLNHTTHRFVTAEAFPSRLIYVTKLGYTWVDVDNDLTAGKFFESVPEAVKSMQENAVNVYMEKR